MTPQLLEKTNQLEPRHRPTVRASGPASQRDQEKERASEILEYAINRHPNDIWAQQALFFQTHRIPSALGRRRSIAVATEGKYVQALRTFVNELDELNIRVRNLNELTTKHLVRVMRAWEEKGLSASTLATRYSCLKRVYMWMGKGGGLGSVKSLMANPQSAMRSYSAVTQQAWDQKGVALAELLPLIDEQCPYTGAHLRLCQAFGLRVQEAISLKPEESDKGDALLILHGAKGGRGRTIPVASEYQREVLDHVRMVAHPRTGLLRKSSQTLAAAKSHFYEIMRRFGLTKSGLGVTAHGLRHQYANQEYKNISGEDAPVNGGLQIDRETEMTARKAVTERLGHSRTQITTAYTGSQVNIARYKRKNMQSLLLQLQARRGELGTWFMDRATEQAEQGVEVILHVIGPEADGVNLPQGFPLTLAMTLQPQNAAQAQTVPTDLIQECQAAAQKQTGRTCLVQDMRLVPADLARLELIFAG